MAGGEGWTFSLIRPGSVRAEVFKSGDKVFVDTHFSGLLKAVVVSVRPEVNEVRVRYTVKHGAYQKGLEETWKASDVVKRGWVHRTKYGYTVRVPRELQDQGRPYTSFSNPMGS